MIDFLNSLGITLLYLALLGAGIIYAAFIFIGGALHDVHLPGFDLHAGGHVDIGHDVGAGHAIDGHVVDAHADTAGHGHAGVDQQSVKVPVLSPITIASFITAFGAFGLIGRGLFTTSTRDSLFWATIGGILIAALAYFAFSYLLIRPQGSSEVQLNSLIGTVAEVITPIPADSVGEIAFVAQGGRLTYTAKSGTGAPIARGATVVIDKIVGGVAVVHPQA
jgi:hypothetical protein